jgi:hypothetical protein
MCSNTSRAAFLRPEVSTEMGIRQTGYESVNWIKLPWDRNPKKLFSPS